MCTRLQVNNNLCVRVSNKPKCHLNTNLGLESLMARADEAFRVIAHSVSAAFA